MADLPNDVNEVVERALQLSRGVLGFLGDNEARFLGTLAACAPAGGVRASPKRFDSDNRNVTNVQMAGLRAALKRRCLPEPRPAGRVGRT